MRVKGSEPLPASTSGQFTRCPLNHPKHCIICYAYSIDTQATPLTLLTQLSPINRKYLIAGLVGEYEYLCHDDLQDDDMTPAEHYAKLVKYTDDELLECSDLIDSPYANAEDFYEYHSSYCPSEYWV